MAEHEFDITKSIFETHPSSSRSFDFLIGKDSDGERGLLQWIKHTIKEELPDEWVGAVEIGTFPQDEMVKKSVFPFIQIFSPTDNFEGQAMCFNEHETRVFIVSTVKAPKSTWAYMDAQRYSYDLYDLLRSRTPSDDHDQFENTPFRGDVDGDFRKGQNYWLGYSKLEVIYRWDISSS